MINIRLDSQCHIKYNENFKKYMSSLKKQLTVNEIEYCVDFPENNYAIVPLGFWEILKTKLEFHKIEYRLEDTRTLSPLSFELIAASEFKPRDYQSAAVEALAAHDMGGLSAPTGSGKTQIFIYLMQKLKQKTLIIVPTSDLLNQTLERIKQVLIFNFEKHLGQYGDGIKDIKDITVGTWQSVSKDAHLFQDFGLLICDEHHKSGAPVYFDLLNKLPAKYRYGVSATPRRFDDTILLSFLMGKIKHTISIEALYDLGHLIRPEVYFVKTPFSYTLKDFTADQLKFLNDMQRLGILKSEIAADEDRSFYLLDFIELNKMAVNMVLSYEREHAEFLFDNSQIENKLLLHGGLPKKERKAAFQKIKDDDVITIFGTQSLLGEGIDIPKLECLFLVSPTGSGNKTVQFCGRILRPYKNKTVVRVYDFVDSGLVEKMKWGRLREYKRLNPVFKT